MLGVEIAFLKYHCCLCRGLFSFCEWRLQLSLCPDKVRNTSTPALSVVAKIPAAVGHQGMQEQPIAPHATITENGLQEPYLSSFSLALHRVSRVTF